MVEHHQANHSSHEEEPGLLYRLWSWFFNPNYDDRRYLPVYQINDPLFPHVHQWNWFTSRRNKWRIVNSKPEGTSYDIDQVIAAVKANPSFTETKLDMLESWKASGTEIVYVSHNVYKCKLCGQTKEAEFFTHPSKKTGSNVTVIDFANRRKNRTTQRIPIIIPSKREIAVERMPRYK